MSNTIATDILDYENNLREAGVPDKHAMAHARNTAKLMENNLATKHDLKHGLQVLHLKMTITLGSIMLTGLGLIKLLKL